jgi:general secretion pathway protein A
MYCKFYGLKERPFNVTSDPAFFFLSKKHKEALSHLLYGASQRKGLIVLTGEIGTGKTTLCRFFLNQLSKEVKTAFILNPNLSQLELLYAIVNDFGIKPQARTRLSMTWELNKFLMKESETGNNTVLIIDEAQSLRPSLLEQLRLLSNLETDKDKLLQVILVGQPELSDKLNLYGLRQLKQRVMVKFHISPLEADEVKEYIQHRLNVAGCADQVRFSQEAIQFISDFSCGTPRLINMICDRALLAGFVAEARDINLDIIKKCSDEFQVCPA